MIYLVNIIGVVLIILVIWWFWLSSEKNFIAPKDQIITILVEGGIYHPAQIEVPAGQTIAFKFIRKDPTPCAETVIFPELNRSLLLPVDKAQIIHLNLPQKGEYTFTCQMGMYRGKLIAK